MTFRDYQEEAAATALLEGPSMRRLLVLPTGAGKSVIIRKIIEDALAYGAQRILIMVHKRELVQQLYESMTEIEGAEVVVEQAEQIGLQENPDFNVAVCSKQTLMSRPEVLDPYEWDLVFIDETHRALSDGYLDLLERLGVVELDEEGYVREEYASDTLLTAFTATDYRGDKRPLTELFTSVAYKRDILWGWKNRWLVPIRARRIAMRELIGLGAEDRVLTDEEVFEAVFETFMEECVELTDEQVNVTHPTLIMARNVQQGIDLAEYFKTQGVRAEMVYSDMDTSLRDQFVQEYKEGTLDVLLGYNILIEGFDAPRASCLMWLRNTESPVTFVQGLGRIGRPFFTDPEAFERFNASTSVEERDKLIAASAKPEGKFFDFADAATRYNVITLGSLTDLNRDFDFEGEYIDAVLEDLEALTEGLQIISSDAIESASQIGRVIEETEFFREAVVPNVGVPENAQLVYTKHRNVWRTSFPYEDPHTGHTATWVIKITQDPRGEWQAFIGQAELWKYWYYNSAEGQYMLRYHRGKDIPDTSKTMQLYVRGKKETVPKYVKVSGMPFQLIAAAATKPEIFYLAEQYVYNNFNDVWKLKHKDAPWRFREPSPRQQPILAKIRKKGIPLPENLTSGVASEITDLFIQGLLQLPRLKRKKAI